MKKILFPLLISLSPAFLSAQSPGYHSTPEHPVAGQTVILDADADVEIQMVVPVMLSGAMHQLIPYQGQPGHYALPVSDSTAGFMIIARGKGGQPDQASAIVIYGKGGMAPEKGAFLALSLVAEPSKEMLHLPGADSLGVAWMEKEFQAWPDNKKTHLEEYILALATFKGRKAQAQVLQELDELSRQKTLAAKDAFFLYNFYNMYDETVKAAKYATLLQDKYGDARYALSKKKMDVLKDENYSRKLEIYRSLEMDGPAWFVYHNAVSGALLKDEYITPKLILDSKPKEVRARTYYATALALATRAHDTVTAAKYAQWGLEVARTSYAHPLDEDDQRTAKFNLGKANEVTACILALQGRYAEALPFYDTAFKYAAPFPMLDVEDYYLQTMAHSNRYAEVKGRLEQRIKKSQESPAVKEALKAIYEREPGHEAAGFNGYLAGLETQRNDSLNLHVKNTMVNLPAPDFALEDMKGNKVSLASLKGKTVIVDFWATWCGPCIASFPAMKRVIEKYKDEKDVVFLFVDTWESLPDPKTKVGNFLKGKDLPFTILLDKDDKVITSYGVKGIPTKFIIDKNGNTRYNVTGYPPGEDAMVAELSSMIEMAKKS